MNENQPVSEPGVIADEPLVIGSRSFRSRLFVGTGKYASLAETARALELSGAEVVTVAVRRMNLDPARGESLLDHVDRERYTILPNTAGCFDAESAVRVAELSRDLLEIDLVKLEVLGDKQTLLPDPVGTCLLYTSPSPRDQRGSRMPSSA